MFDYQFRVTLTAERDLTFIEQSQLEVALHNLIAGRIACADKVGTGEFADLEVSSIDVERTDI